MTESFWVSLNVALQALSDFWVLLAVLVLGYAVYGLTTGIRVHKQIFALGNAGRWRDIVRVHCGAGVGRQRGPAVAGGGGWKALMIAIIGCVSIVLMRVSLWINDRLILWRFRNLKEIIHERNLGVAFTECGGCLATGLMIFGVMSGRLAYFNG